MKLRTTILPPEPDSSIPSNGRHPALEEPPQEELREEAIQQIANDELTREQAVREVAKAFRTNRRHYVRKLLELSKSRKTPRILLEIWQSDYSIIAFALMVGSFYLMKYTGLPVIGLCFFILAMATVDSILSIFVVRLSFHQNKHGFYRTEDFERDWLRYRILLSMSRATLLFVVLTSCGTACVVASYIAWFFTVTQRLRYIILRWSMDEHYPELQRWSIFTILHEAGIETKRKNYTIVALAGVAIAFAIVLVF